LKTGKIPEVFVKLNRGVDESYQALLLDAKDPSKELTYTVIRTYGGGEWKQRYQAKIGNHHYVVPNSCNGCHKDRAGDETGLIKGVQAYESKF
jgi:hypothetical protein